MIAIVVILLTLFSASPVRAQSEAAGPAGPTQTTRFYLGRVSEVVSSGVTNYSPYQLVRVDLASGDAPETGEIQFGGAPTSAKFSPLRVGDRVVVASSEVAGVTQYFVADRFRLPEVAYLVASFFLIAVWFGGKRGVSSIFGLAVTIAIVAGFLIPQIASGSSPLLVGSVSAVVIAVVSLYISHGVSRRTTVALVSTLLTLGVAIGLAMIYTRITHLSGGASEEAYFLQVAGLPQIDLRGLFLAGVIIGALGVLDDITTSQAAAVEEISRANPRLSSAHLYHRGLSVGQEHIASLINTLVLAYTGASFPLLLLFATGADQPFWLVLNSEQILEEVIRTLVGSAALVLAVPVTTYLASSFLKNPAPASPEIPPHTH